MAKSNNQKGKILYLERILQETGENRAVSMQELLDLLAEKGVTAERKSIYDDLAVLRDFGMDIRYHRGKPGGYYLAGEAAASEEMRIPSESENVQLEAEDVQQDVEAVPERKIPSWLEASAETKQMKLLCENSVRQDVEACIGKNGLYKDKGATAFTVAAEIAETPEFYGWLTAMGGRVHIMKPKKTAAAYRDYLKELAREYKGV